MATEEREDLGGPVGNGSSRARTTVRAWLGVALACLLAATLAFVGVAVAQDEGTGGEPDSGQEQPQEPNQDPEGDEETGKGKPDSGKDKGRGKEETARTEGTLDAAATGSQNPVADAYVRADQPSTNFGRSTAIRLKGDPASNGYLRFDVNVPSGETVTKATLRVWTADSSGSGITAHKVSDNNWSETGITHDNAPNIGEKVGESGSYSGNSYVSIDVTSLVTGSGEVSIGLKRSSNTTNWFNSREAGSNPPELIVESSALPPPPPPPPPSGTTLVADSYVRADQPATNFGRSTAIRLKGDPASNGYLRFDVNVPTGETVTKATLKVYSTQSSGSGITVHGVSDNSWGETSITYDNAPPIGEQVGGVGSYGSNTYVSLDVTALVKGSGPVSMALKRGGSTNWFNSREAASNPPQLIVESSVLPPPPPPPPPSGATLLADSYVRADLPASNFGKSSAIRVDGSPTSNGYLRFDVNVPTGETVANATLKLYTSDSSGSGITVHGVSDNSWGETTITYDNAPPIGSAVGESGAYVANSYTSIDVTSLVKGSGVVSMAVKRSSSTTNWFNSREAGFNPPQLIVDTELPSTAQTIVYALGDGADGSALSKGLADYVKAQTPDRFVYLGDVYETGTATDFSTKYEPLYGSMASITDPVIGNHEWPNRTTGYIPYWQGKRGWTSEQALHRAYVDPSGWQLIFYNSEGDMSAEGTWVANEVAKHAGTCRIVAAHKGRHVVVDSLQSDNSNQESVWSSIITKTAINLVGHNHIYGRTVPISGVHVLVSGAGGHNLRTLGTQHHSVADSQTGIPTATKLVLRRGAADFQQVGKDGTVYDSGTIGCTPAG